VIHGRVGSVIRMCEGLRSAGGRVEGADSWSVYVYSPLSSRAAVRSSHRGAGEGEGILPARTASEHETRKTT